MRLSSSRSCSLRSNGTQFRFRLTGFSFVVWCFALSACGGGSGGSSSETGPAQPPNRAPIFSSPSSFSLLEGVTDVEMIRATDPDGDRLSYKIVSGDDRDLFVLETSGRLSFRSRSDFEAPADADSDNEYALAIEVSDGSLTERNMLAIAVEDAFEGRVVDGPLAQAHVFVDLNGDNQQNDEEPSGFTDSEGFFSLPMFDIPEGDVVTVISSGGTDIQTGVELPDIALTAELPVQAAELLLVTPITTLLSTVPTREAKAAVLAAMGITATPDQLLSNDPWAGAEAEEEDAKSIQRLNQQLGLLLQTSTTLAIGSDSTDDLAVERAEAVVTEVAAVVVAGGEIDLTSALILEDIFAASGTAVDPGRAIEANAIAAVSDAVAVVNAVVGDPFVDPVSDVYSDIVKATQEDLQTLVDDVTHGELSHDEFLQETKPEALFEDIAVSADSLDTDEDGISDELDADDDGDGVNDAVDAFPKNSTESQDTDGDGIGNSADADDDGDGVQDTTDAFPLDSSEAVDTDGDGIGNNSDSDDDGDGVNDVDDDFPLDSNVHTTPTTAPQSLALNLLPQGINTLTGSLSATSQNDRPVTYEIVANGALGTAIIDDVNTGAFRYLTAQTDAGSDTFTYRVNDGFVDSSPSTISVSLKSDPLYKHQWHLHNTGQNNFASFFATSGEDLNVDAVIVSGVTGQGVIIAVVDDGLELAHEDLSPNVVEGGSFDFVNNDTDPTQSGNEGGHGTSVAGIIAAQGWNDLGVRGVAPNASLKGYNFIRAQSDANLASALGGQNYSSDVDIFNLSIGSAHRYWSVAPQSQQAMVRGFRNLRSNKGAIAVKAAGNFFDGISFHNDYSTYRMTCGGATRLSCQDAIQDPWHVFPEVIVIGSLAANGEKASYSSATAALWVSGFGGEYGVDATFVFSTSFDAYEPAIMTTDRSSCSAGYVSDGVDQRRYNAFNDSIAPHAENPECNYVSTFNGTSAAAPTVSGTIALMLEENPMLTWRDVKHILAETARQVDSSFSPVSVDGIQYHGWVTNSAGFNFHNFYGFGAIDAGAAVAAAQTFAANSFEAQASLEVSSTANHTLLESAATSVTINNPDAGTVEYVRVALNLNTPGGTVRSLGIRLESPSGTMSTILQPWSWANVSVGVEQTVHLASSAFYGESISGDWKVHFYDHQADGDQVFIETVALELLYR